MSGGPPIDTGGLAKSATIIGLVLLLLVSMVGGMTAFEGVNDGNVKVVKNQGAVTGEDSRTRLALHHTDR